MSTENDIFADVLCYALARGAELNKSVDFDYKIESDGESQLYLEINKKRGSKKTLFEVTPETEAQAIAKVLFPKDKIKMRWTDDHFAFIRDLAEKGLSQKEVCEMIGKTPNALKVAYFRRDEPMPNWAA